MEEQMQNQGQTGAAAAVPTRQIDQFELDNYLRKVKSEQNLAMGIMGGLAGMVVGAVLWAAITVLTDYQIGYMAIGVGFLVGLGVRLLGKGLNKSFGVVAAVLALLGCLLGNALIVLVLVSQLLGLPFTEVLFNLDVSFVVGAMVETFEAIDILFFALAVYTGYRYAFRRVTTAEIEQFAR